MKIFDVIRKNRLRLLLVFGVIALVVAVHYITSLCGKVSFIERIWVSLDPVVGFTTLLLAIVIFYQQLEKDWKESLPKRLTVSYIYKGRVIMRIEKANLFDDKDIRQWAQSLGYQLFTKFDFDLGWKIIQNGVVKKGSSKKRYVNYEMTIFLTKDPLRGIITEWKDLNNIKDVQKRLDELKLEIERSEEKDKKNKENARKSLEEFLEKDFCYSELSFNETVNNENVFILWKRNEE